RTAHPGGRRLSVRRAPVGSRRRGPTRSTAAAGARSGSARAPAPPAATGRRPCRGPRTSVRPRLWAAQFQVVADGLTELPGPLVVGRQRTQFPDGELLGPFRVLQEHGEQIDAAVV